MKSPEPESAPARAAAEAEEGAGTRDPAPPCGLRLGLVTCFSPGRVGATPSRPLRSVDKDVRRTSGIQHHGQLPAPSPCSPEKRMTGTVESLFSEMHEDLQALPYSRWPRKPGVVLHTCNLSTWTSGAEECTLEEAVPRDYQQGCNQSLRTPVPSSYHPAEGQREDLTWP